jgi:ribosomal protein S19E (S16A)
MTNNKQQTAVEWFAIEMAEYLRSMYGDGIINIDILKQAKEMEKERSQAYAAFCVACDRKKLPLLEFDGWIKLEGSNK